MAVICWLVGTDGICKFRTFQKLSCSWRSLCRHSKAANYEKEDDPLSWKVFERLGASLFPVSSIWRGFTCIQGSKRQFKKLIKLLFPPSFLPCGDIIAGDPSSSPKSSWSIFRNISRYFAIYQSPPAHPLATFSGNFLFGGNFVCRKQTNTFLGPLKLPWPAIKPCVGNTFNLILCFHVWYKENAVFLVL